MLLKQNAYGRRYKNYVSIPRPFSRRFHKLFPGFRDYRPCHWCWADTQWFQDIDVSRPINMRIYNLLHKDWGLRRGGTYEPRYSEGWYSRKKCSNSGRKTMYGFVRLVGIMQRENHPFCHHILHHQYGCSAPRTVLYF